MKSLIVAAGMLVGGSAWADETKTSVYSNDFETSSDWTAKGKTDGWTVNPGTTTANTFNSSVIGVGAGGGDMGLVSPSFTIASDITLVDVELKFKMDACTSGKSSGIEFVTSDVNINNGYVSAGTPFFGINASANGNGYWGSITVGGNDHTSVLKQTGTFENNNLNRNTTGIVVLNVRFNFTSKIATYTLAKADGTSLVASTTVSFANSDATTLDRIFLHAGKTYGGVTIDDVKVYSVVADDVAVTYNASFTETAGLNPEITIYEDEARTTSIVNGLLEDGKTYYYTATLAGYYDYTGSFTVNGDNTSVEFTMAAKPTFTYNVYAVDESANKLQEAPIATGTKFEGETVTVKWSKYIQIEGKWYVTTENSFYATATENGEKKVVYKEAEISYFFEMENLTRSGGAYLTEESASYSNNARLRISKGSTYYTPALAEGIYSISIPWENSNNSASEVYVYTRSSEGTLSDKLATFTANKGGGTFKAIISVPEGYSIAFNGNEGSYNNNARMDYMTLAPAKETKKISAAGYATYFSANALDFSGTGLTAYVAKVTDSDVTFEAVTKVPAKTGVLLKGAEGSYQIPVVADGGEATSALVGVLEDMKVPAGSYVLMNGAQGVGFYKTASEFTVGANTAYLPAQTTGVRSFIGFDGESSTGISAVENAVLSTEVYDLQGRRVAQPTKGLYIMNGKKTVVR